MLVEFSYGIGSGFVVDGEEFVLRLFSEAYFLPVRFYSSSLIFTVDSDLMICLLMGSRGSIACHLA